MVICLERDADLHMAQLMPLPLTVYCFSKIPIGFTFLVPARPGSPGKRAGPLNGCVWYWCRWPGCSCGRVVGPYDVQWNRRCQRRAVDQWHDHRQCRAGGLRCRGSARPGAGEATEELRRVGPVGRRRRSHTEGQPARTDSGMSAAYIASFLCENISVFQVCRGYGDGSPWVWVWSGYGDRNSVPTAALQFLLVQHNASMIPVMARCLSVCRL